MGIKEDYMKNDRFQIRLQCTESKNVSGKRIRLPLKISISTAKKDYCVCPIVQQMRHIGIKKTNLI